MSKFSAISSDNIQYFLSQNDIYRENFKRNCICAHSTKISDLTNVKKNSANIKHAQISDNKQNVLVRLEFFLSLSLQNMALYTSDCG